MKIDKVTNLIPVERKKSPSPGKTAEGDKTFQTILNAEKNSHATEKVSPSDLSTGEILPTTVSGVNPVSESLWLKDSILKVEKCLDSLEKYGKVLENSQVPAENLGEIVSELDRHGQELNAALNTFPDSSPLKQIMEDVASLTAKEGERFRRGDYN